MSKISKKYFGPDQVDGSILKLEKDQAVRIKKQDGSEVQLISLDIDDNPMMLGSRLTKKSEHDSLQGEFSTEKGKISTLQSEMSQAQADISSEASRAEGQENLLKGRMSTAEGEIDSLQSEMSLAQSDILQEVSRAEGQENLLKGRVSIVESDVSAILSASQADQDSFAEIVQLINSVDVTNDQAFAGYVLSNNQAVSSIEGRLDLAEPKITTLQSDLSSEASARASGDSALSGRLDIVEPKVTQLESDMVDLQSYDLDLRSDVDDQEAYGLDLRSDLDQESSDRAAADTAKLVEAKAYTDSKIAAIPAVDLSSFETIANVDSKDAAKLLEAKSYADAQIAAIPAVDLSGYYTKSQVDSKESGLQSSVNAEKERIDAILLASDADKDTFVEIVQLINSVDTTNDQAFAGYVLSNNTAVGAVSSDLAAYVLQNDININSIHSQMQINDERAAGAEEGIQSLLDGEIERATGAEQGLEESKVNRSGDNISGMLTFSDESGMSVEVYAGAVEIYGSEGQSGHFNYEQVILENGSGFSIMMNCGTGVEVSENGVPFMPLTQSSLTTKEYVDQEGSSKLDEAKAYTDAQVQAIVDGPSFGRFNAVVGASTSEFMLDKSVKGIMSCANGRVALHEGFDFTVSVDSVTGFSKLTFIGPSAAGGASEIESSDQIFVVYAF